MTEGTSRLEREADGAVVAARVELARTFGKRFLGLMGRAGLAPGAALWLEPESSIHMMFMRFRIDAVFLDAQGVVLKVVKGLRPWIGVAACSGSTAIVELAAGEADRAGLAAGDRLRLRAASGAG
jgi:uncharacterized membrane protein (UPF0127 family)